ncbi:hypothetical protein DL771_004018 [Monosporascus sp. 5C6A]|nr:hypothetical protein DL771_004018 [Monosporascus sp. 5C6A]
MKTFLVVSYSSSGPTPRISADDGSRTRSDRSGILDAAIQRMLSSQPGRQVPGYSSHEREIQDSSRLENLSLASYAGDTRITIQSPEARDLVLNSAPRVYYTGWIAKILDCVDALIHEQLPPVQKLLTPVYWQDLINKVNNWDNFRNLQKMALRPTTLEQDVITLNASYALYASQNTSIGAPVSSDTEVDQERHPQHLNLRDFIHSCRDDNGSGGVFQELPVPDCEAGSAPVGPGPVYHTGGTIASDVSSIAQSAQTLFTRDNDTNTETETVTAGRSVAVVLSASAGASTMYGDEDGTSSVWTPAFTLSEGRLDEDHDEEASFDADDEVVV